MGTARASGAALPTAVALAHESRLNQTLLMRPQTELQWEVEVEGTLR
jgi:hypothetical protein